LKKNKVKLITNSLFSPDITEANYKINASAS
jgi:hypothetical protein